MRLLAVLYSCIFFLSSIGTSNAQTTKVTVRALAKDAKFIGTGIGGAYVVIRDNRTQEVLAKGYTEGSSGDTEIVVKNPKHRQKPITDEQTAKFVGELQIAEPVFVDVEVTAPANRKHSAVTASTQLWVIPGKDIIGDGIILEIPGFIVDILSPHTHEVLLAKGLADGKIPIKVHLVLMCGCLVQKGGIWDSDNMEVSAIVKREGKIINEVSFVKTTADNVFEAALSAEVAGNYEVIVQAFDRVTNNTGVDKISFVVK